MLIADFTNAQTDTIMISGLFQWDYGQQLEIRGLNLPEMVQIHFSTSKDCGDALRMVGTTLDGITTVKIPDILLAEQEFCNDTYTIWAFVYVSYESSGETVKRVAIKTKSRPKPEDYTEPEHENPFEDTLEQVKQYADQAEQSASDAESAEEGAEQAYQDTIEAVEQIREDHIAMVEKIAIKPTASGTDIVAEDSTDWRLLDFTAQGWTEQTVTTGAQLFDISKIIPTNQVYTDEEKIYVEILTSNGRPGGEPNTLKNYCPDIIPGETYMLNFETTGTEKNIYLLGANIYWRANETKKITDEMLKSTVYFYASGINTKAVISNFMINRGDIALPYEPYSGGYPSPRPEIKTNQLFDASKLESKTQGGATIINNGDGSFTISGEGNLTENFYAYYDLSHEDSLKLVKSGSINLSCESVTKPHFSFHLRNASESAALMLSNALNATASGTIEASMLEDENSYVRFGFYAESESVVVPGTIRPMLYQDGDGTWEPYGTVEAWPQPIRNAVSHGAFDGILRQGGYSASNGKYSSNNSYVCNQNSIRCKPKDKISILCEKEFPILSIMYYKKNGDYIGYISNTSGGAASKLDAVMPDETAYCNINLGREGSEILRPNEVGNIRVLLNDRYPVEITLRTAQLFDASKIQTKSQGGVTVTNNGDGSFTISGSGNLTGEYVNNYNISHKDFVSLFKEGNIYVKIEQETDPFFFVNLNNSQGYVRTIVRTNKNNATTGNITQNELDDETSFLNIGINGVDGRAIVPGTIRPMLYQDGDGTWEPYKSKSITITSDRPLTKWDKLEKREGKWGWSYGGKILEFDGTENWNIYHNGFYVSGGLDNISKDINYLYESKCNFFKRLYSESLQEIGYVLTTTGGSYSPLFKNTIYSDVEEWKTWLKQKKTDGSPIEFLYPLEISEWVELSEEEQSALNALETYYPTTVIQNSANMEMQAKYVADPENYLRKNYQEKLEQIDVLSGQVAMLQEYIIKEV